MRWRKNKRRIRPYTKRKWRTKTINIKPTRKYRKFFIPEGTGEEENNDSSDKYTTNTENIIIIDNTNEPNYPYEKDNSGNRRRREQNTECQKTRNDNQSRREENTTNQTNRILIDVLYCFAINLLNKKLNKKLRWEQIENIIKVINNNVNNEKEYINNIKKSHRIKETTKRYIKWKWTQS